MQLIGSILLLAFFSISCSFESNQRLMAASGKDTAPLPENGAPITNGGFEEQPCFIKKITGEKGQVFILADYIQRLEGEKAVEEAKKRGEADTALIDGKAVIGVVNDYYIINDNPKIRKLPLDPRVTFELIKNPDRYGGKVENTLQGLQLIYEDNPFILTIKNGKVIKVSEIFVP